MKALAVQAVAITNRHRKLIAAAAGVAVALFGERAGIGPEALTLAVVTIVSYIAGTAVEDAAASRG